jgi:hypothetical protein
MHCGKNLTTFMYSRKGFVRLYEEKIRSMKQALIFLILPAFLFIGCQNKSSKRIFHASALQSEHVRFDIGKDTSFKTKHGTIVRIPAGSLQSTGNTVVELEIKEAFTVAEMIRAGLPTHSDGKPMSSGGVIYFNVVGDDQVRISKPFQLAIPTVNIDDSMKLYRGELDDDSNMNWIDPKPMVENPQWKALNTGRDLFINNCASCHAINKKMLGPDLAHIVKRSKPVPFGEEGYVQNGHNLLYDFTRNNQAVLKWSLYYRCLYNQYNKMPMNLFPDLTETELNNIYAYIENESEVKKLPVPDNGIENCLDSCLLYAEAKIRLKQMKSGLEGDSSRESEQNFIFNASTKDTSINKRIVVTRAPLNYMADLEVVDPIRKKPLYYQFNMDAFGWHNIEKPLDQEYGSKESLMLVRVNGSYSEKVDVYLVVPSMRVVAQGTILDKEKNTYGFYSKDGTVSLPQNADAVVIALQEGKDTVYFAKKDFVTSNAQYFDLTLSPMKASSLKKEMNLASNNNMALQVKEQKSNSELRRKIKDVTDAEELRPKNCDCSCFTIQPVDMESKANKKEVSSAKILPPAKDSASSGHASRVKDSISSRNSLTISPKKQASTSSSTKTVKKAPNTTKKPVSAKKKKPVYKGKLAKR